MGSKSLNLSAAVAVIALSFVLLLTVKAQQSAPLLGGSPAMNYSRVLLKRKDVQNELGLDALQKEALAKLLEQWDLPVVVRPVINRNILRFSDEERKQWEAEIKHQAAEQIMKIRNERQRGIDEVLRPDQRERLTELDLQFRGILALGDKSLSDRLGVSPAHHKCIAEILADFEVKRIKLSSYSDRSENTDSPRYQKRRALLQETEQKVLALLSDEEKSRWAQAVGRPFSFTE